MSRIQHIKIVTDAPDDVREFLRDVADFPEGFDITSYSAVDPQGNVQPRAKQQPVGPDLTWDDIASLRALNGEPGFIAGTVESRQLQVFPGSVPGIWAVAIGTRDVEGAYAKCKQRGFPATEISVTPFNGSSVRAFFALVGGITFELMRVEPAA